MKNPIALSFTQLITSIDLVAESILTIDVNSTDIDKRLIAINSILDLVSASIDSSVQDLSEIELDDITHSYDLASEYLMNKINEKKSGKK